LLVIKESPMLTGFAEWWTRGWRHYSDNWRGGLDAPRRDPDDAASRRSAGDRLIARSWHGRVPAHKADAYERYLSETGLADSRATPGHRGSLTLRHDAGDETHFLLITLWESRDAIARFAGCPLERARYYPEDHRFLIELEPCVTHHDVVTAS
jgi:heme-degrading monooxygenase HmoA